MQKQIQKTFFVSEMIASDNLAINCLCEEENISHPQSMG